jgi:hypothetical protein
MTILPKEKVHAISLFVGIALGVSGLAVIIPRDEGKRNEVPTPKASYANALGSGTARPLGPWMLGISAVAFGLSFVTRKA